MKFRSISFYVAETRELLIQCFIGMTNDFYMAFIESSYDVYSAVYVVAHAVHAVSHAVHEILQ